MKLRGGNPFVLFVVGAVVWTTPVFASFHLMQIEQVIGGVNGDTTAQAIQLRMRLGGQNLLNPSRIRVFDAAGLNPVLIYDFISALPNFTVASGAGRRILLTSPNFPLHTTPPAVDDISGTMNLIPASYLAAGSLTFETDDGSQVYWRLSWGGAAYTGPGTGVSVGGNDADGNFNPPFPGPLPSTGLEALFFDGLGGDPSTNNAGDYLVTAGSAVFINNATVPGMFTVVECTSTPQCDDGLFCTGTETCSAGACQSTGNPCSGTCNEITDACVPTLSSLGMLALIAAMMGIGAVLASRRRRAERA
ncbi:MAG: hypothetical protein AABZ47_17245 [Planctomycetota bacterium]